MQLTVSGRGPRTPRPSTPRSDPASSGSRRSGRTRCGQARRLRPASRSPARRRHIPLNQPAAELSGAAAYVNRPKTACEREDTRAFSVQLASDPY
jgi:hypothetical protein